MSNTYHNQSVVHPRLISILQTHANERGTTKGHALGVWQHAKRKYGQGSIKALCGVCGMSAIIMPYGDAQGAYAWLRKNPGMRGDALVLPCVSSKITEPPAGLFSGEMQR